MQKEIDLIGVKETDGQIRQAHIEVSVSTSGHFKKINAKPYSEAIKRLEVALHQRELRLTILLKAKLTIQMYYQH